MKRRLVVLKKVRVRRGVVTPFWKRRAGGIRSVTSGRGRRWKIRGRPGSHCGALRDTQIRGRGIGWAGVIFAVAQSQNGERHMEVLSSNKGHDYNSQAASHCAPTADASPAPRPSSPPSPMPPTPPHPTPHRPQLWHSPPPSQSLPGLFAVSPPPQPRTASTHAPPGLSQSRRWLSLSCQWHCRCSHCRRLELRRACCDAMRR